MAWLSRIGVLTAAAVIIAIVGPACAEPGEAPAPSAALPNPGAGAIRVDAAQARRGVLAREVTAMGMTSAWRDANLRAEVGGRVLEVTVDNGDVVEAGALLLRIDGSRQRLAVSGASARVDGLEHDVALAQTEYERKQGLVAKGSLAAAQLDGAKHALDRAEAALAGANAELGSARRASKDAKMIAPIDGVVTRRMVDMGDTIGAGSPLLDLVDLSKIRVRVGLAGSEIGRLDQDAEARVTIEDLGGESTLARFAALAPAADPVTGLFEVEYHLDNPEGRIRGGMVATISLPLRKGGERVLIPRAALTRRAGKLAVFVLLPLTPVPDRVADGVGDGLERRVVELREVRVGAYAEHDVEIIAGVEPGDVLAVSAQHALADAVLVEIEQLPTGTPTGTPAATPAPTQTAMSDKK